MGKFLVSYDLSQPNRDYEKVSTFLKSHTDWAKILESVWIVESWETPLELAKQLKNCVDGNDHFVVTPVSLEEFAWYNLNPAVVEWLKGRAAA